MTPQSRIIVLGVHRLAFDDATVSLHLHEFRIPPGPELERIRAEVREMLGSTVLVELLVIDRDERFHAADFRQPITEKRWWQGILPNPRTWYLTADGERRLEYEDQEDGGPVPPMDVTTFRVAISIRGWDETKPLQSSYGDHRCPEINAIPERLNRLAPYSWVGD
jgi:hypothetical protein